MFDRISKMIFVIGIVMLIIGSCLAGWNEARIININRREIKVREAEEYWEGTSVTTRYRKMKEEVEELKEEIINLKQLNEIAGIDLMVERGAKDHAKNLVEILSYQISYLEELAKVNGIEYVPLEY